MKRPFVIITTELPPASCGIGTYSSLLRRHWPNESRSVEFLVMDAPARPSVLRNSDRITPFHGRGGKLGRELDRIGAADVLLHYAGRAYQRWGCPLWLPGALARWKRDHPGSRLTIFAHEIPGEMPITSHHFWLGKANAWILRRLASIGDLLVTNTSNHAAQWRNLSHREDIHVVPVASNIEPVTAALEPRARGEFLIFGLSFGRLQTLLRFAEYIHGWKVDGRITKLHLVGLEGDDFSERADQLMQGAGLEPLLVRRGFLTSAEVAGLLAVVEFALTNVTEETWSKSSTFMACAAHACPIVVSEAPSATAPLSYTVAAREVSTISASELGRRGAALASWYRENADWPVIASQLANLTAR